MVNVKVKVATLFLVVLLLCSPLINAGRREPAFSNGSVAKNQQHDQGVNGAEHAEVVEESCEGVGEEECLMRRTLVAHIDYIYTQKHNKP